MPCSFDDKVIIEKAEFKKFTAGGDIFRVGIICDTQLPPNEKKLEENDLYVRHLRTALSANAHIKAFKKVLGQSPWTHYVVNGYHFIGASPNNGSMSCGYKLTSKWLARELEKASKDTPDKPIFVMTHN